MYARVHTVNGSVISSGYKTSVEITHKDTFTDRTECQGNTGPELANQAWEERLHLESGDTGTQRGEPSEQDAGRSDGAERA